MSTTPIKPMYTDKNALIFTIVRMNPPTPGHLFVIKQLIEKAVELNISTVYVFLSKTQHNDTKNANTKTKRT